MPETTDSRGNIPEWYDRRANVGDLVQFLLDEGWGADEVAEAVRRPWKYADEYLQMREASPA